MGRILENLEIIIANEGITVGALERRIGASKGVLSRAMANGTDIQAKWVVSIVENYPQYNAEWLLTGVGPMLKNKELMDSNSGNGHNRTSLGNSSDDKDNEKHPINKPILYNKEDWMQDTLSEPCSNAVQTLMKHEAVHRAATPSADILAPLLDRIQQQAEEIGALKERIRKMEEEREKLAAAARSSVIADAG